MSVRDPFLRHPGRGRPVGWPTRRGFTLAEILVVVLVMGVAAAVGIPLLHSALNEADLAAAAAEVAVALEYAQRASVRTDRTCRVTISAAGDTLLVERLGIDRVLLDPGRTEFTRAQGATKGYEAMWHPLKPGIRYRVDFATDRRFGGVDVTAVSFGGGNQVVFDGTGQPSSGGTVTLARQGRTAEVALDGLSGKVELKY